MGHAAEQEFLHGVEATAAQHDQVGMGLGSQGQDHIGGLARFQPRLTGTHVHREAGVRGREHALTLLLHRLLNVLEERLRGFRHDHGKGRNRDIQHVNDRDLFGPRQMGQRLGRCM